MHDPYEWHQILKLGNQQQIDSFVVYDTYLIVGTKQGHLIMYSVTSKGPGQNHEVQLQRYHKNFYRKPIQQLDVVPQTNILIILVDNTIYVHDLSSLNLPLVCELKKTRGANLFTVDVENQTDKSLTHKQSYVIRLCVAVKRKLQLYYWKNNQFLEFGEDISVSEVPKSIAWCKQSICIGFKGDYCLVQLDEEQGKQNELFPTGKTSEPNVIKLTDSTFALIKDSQSVFVDINGKLLVKNAVKWSETPLALAYDEPYLIAVLNNGLEVRTMQPALLVQTIKIEKPQSICRSCSGVLYVSTGVDVFRVQAMPADRQISVLLKEKQFQLALKLCNISDDSEKEKSKNRYHIQTLYAYDLFNNKQYHESMKQFLELDTDPYDVIRLFPNLLPQYSQEDASSVDSSSDGHSSSKVQNRDLEKTLPPLIEYLTEARLKLLTNEKKRDVAEVEQTLQIIDTTLLKCYLHTNDALIAPLLRLNNCHLADCERVLKKHKKYTELIILYETKGLHQRALELLQKQADQPDSSSRDVEKMIQYLQRLGKDYVDLILQFSTWLLDHFPEEALKIFTDDVSEVEQLPRPKILNYLMKYSKESVIPYLEHVIYVWNDTNPILHNSLAHHYREKVLSLRGSKAPSAAAVHSVATDQLIHQNMRLKLISFLEKSEYYTPETVLSHFPLDDLYEERAILLGKLGQHEKALAIYVIVLGDIEKAIRYCDQIYKTGGPNASQVYVHLLQLLIYPPDHSVLGLPSTTPPQPDIEMALTLLESNATRISPEKVLQILPKNIPVRRLKHYLAVSMSEHLDTKRKNQILRGLLYAEHLQVQDLRIRFESQSIFLSEYNICSVCKKRFSNQSAFIRNPNGDVIHVSCQDKEQEIRRQRPI